MTFARIVGGGICTMSPAAARQTRTAQSAAEGRQKSPRESGGFAEGGKLEVKRAGRRRADLRQTQKKSYRLSRETDHPNRRQQPTRNPPFGGCG